MDNQDKAQAESEQSTSDGAKKNIDIPKTISVDDAGYSGSINLPGAIPTPKFTKKPGLSKSEHNLRHIFTGNDVANALKLTSMSFGPTNQAVTNIDFKALKIPMNDNNTVRVVAERRETTPFLEIKKFVANCFKFNKETTGPTIKPDPVQLAQAVARERRERLHDNHEQPNSSTIISRTENTGVQNTNEVIVTQTIVEPKMSKISQTNNKKKMSGSLSERSDLGLANRDSLSSIGSNVCRICMTRGRERLISPCNCKGSLANVHLSCLERWLNQVGRNHCELCGYSYPAIRTPRYTVLQALRLWFGNPRNRSHLQSDCLIFWLLSTVTAGLLAVCIVGTQYFVIEGNKFGKLEAAGVTTRKDEDSISAGAKPVIKKKRVPFYGISHRITETAMDFFMAIVLCGYSVTVYLLWKDHYVMWNRWRRANVNVRLLLSPDSDPVPFVPRSRYNIV